MPNAEPLPPGSAIGILGGGQLGRMLALASARLGLRCHVYCPDPESPAFEVSAAKTVAAYEDRDALAAFARKVDVVTYEFENVDVAAAEFLQGIVPVRPGPRALAVSQDRLAEKQFLRSLGLGTAPFADVPDAATLPAAIANAGLPAILKSRRFGYDGKGQARIIDSAGAEAAYRSIGAGAAILEGFVTFAKEVSIIAARATDGSVVTYDIAENVHRDGILSTSTVPASASPAIEQEAATAAAKVLGALDYVGVIGVEFFVVEADGAERLLVNEFAPRVHNSGHWTEDACLTSQFENHIRAIAGWPLGATTRHSDVVMTNLIGADADAWRDIAAEPGARLYLYGKREKRAGRKMGHVNRLKPPS